MSETCSHNCGSCSSDCANRKPADFLVAPNPHSSIKKVIAVVSGKGGVGKSMVTSTLAVLTQRKGKQTAILAISCIDGIFLTFWINLSSSVKIGSP